MKNRLLTCVVLLRAASSNPLLAQSEAEDDATVSYPAAYFSQYGVVSVKAMLSRIPSIDLPLECNQVPSFGNNNNRSLGATSQIMINGKRLAGKARNSQFIAQIIVLDQALLGYA